MSLRDYLRSNHWNSLYTWGSQSPQAKFYANPDYDEGGFYPMQVDSSSRTATNVVRAGANSYDMGITAPHLNKGDNLYNLNLCVDLTNDPNYCAQRILGKH